MVSAVVNHKTFRPTDLTSIYSVCNRRIFSKIGHRAQALHKKVCTVIATRHLKLLRDHVVPALQERHAVACCPLHAGWCSAYTAREVKTFLLEAFTEDRGKVAVLRSEPCTITRLHPREIFGCGDT
ncbi:hypothetical protein TNCV_1178421 [Trichonephila clavipes]|nr:hypothetical protein TNCV_1178421 [Trichonephila clavipes]